MAAVYEVPWWRTMRHIILPALAVPVFTAVSLASGLAVRITIMAELLGSDDGAGYMIALARTNLDTAKVFAWAVILISLVILLDYAVINPLKRFATRWETEQRKETGQPEAGS
jgi:NitT/TauT family transport system permease protein